MYVRACAVGCVWVVLRVCHSLPCAVAGQAFESRNDALPSPIRVPVAVVGTKTSVCLPATSQISPQHGTGSRTTQLGLGKVSVAIPSEASDPQGSPAIPHRRSKKGPVASRTNHTRRCACSSILSLSAMLWEAHPRCCEPGCALWPVNWWRSPSTTASSRSFARLLHRKPTAATTPSSTPFLAARRTFHAMRGASADALAGHGCTWHPAP